jgi:histone deacetylase complex regulatory component SIN3
MEFYGQGGRPEPEEAVPRIHERMKVIFKDDADLLQEFEAFLPNNHVTRQTAA